MCPSPFRERGTCPLDEYPLLAGWPLGYLQARQGDAAPLVPMLGVAGDSTGKRTGRYPVGATTAPRRIHPSTFVPRLVAFRVVQPLVPGEIGLIELIIEPHQSILGNRLGHFPIEGFGYAACDGGLSVGIAAKPHGLEHSLLEIRAFQEGSDGLGNGALAGHVKSISLTNLHQRAREVIARPARH